MADWIEELKAGDRVAIATGYAGVERWASVTKITATQVVCDSERFRKRDGYAPGDAWNRSRLVQPTKEVSERIEERQLRHVIERASKDKAITLAALRKMNAALQEQTQ